MSSGRYCGNQALDSIWLPGEDPLGKPFLSTQSCSASLPTSLGCRCPPGQLVQDGHCVPISSCRCGLPSANASWELAPAQVVQLDCRNWYGCSPARAQGTLGGGMGRSAFAGIAGEQGLCSP